MATIGQTLTGVRRRAGYSVAGLSERTCITEHVIQALERDDFAACGGDFYVRGHIRGIARALELDPEPLIQQFDQEYAEQAPAPMTADEFFTAHAPDTLAEPVQRKWPIVVAAAVAGVALIGVAHAWPGGDGADDRPSAQAAAQAGGESSTERQPSDGKSGPEPRASARPEPSPSSQEAVRLRIAAQEPTWLSVYNGTGEDVFTGVLEAGKSREWTDPEELRLHIGNAGGVRLEANGRDMGAPGGVGEVVQLTFGPEGLRQEPSGVLRQEAAPPPQEAPAAPEGAPAPAPARPEEPPAPPQGVPQGVPQEAPTAQSGSPGV
ncbi:cytoskeletal protein RodZ [Spinactinospora alkalitolerans]|uniref:Cytoskeletal protein RodZ n=1 Tax=Spinactinospora alkalitolerans TaxID=687207 RepID=A0A852U0R9_9ACTN|nr:helix-turn-helix domain-containing protein [Spinactinospora alkalitolerans]NYE49135.1 cytoskeletal protein RodZ [Spinactinospora alkalitolerans]